MRQSRLTEAQERDGANMRYKAFLIFLLLAVLITASPLFAQRRPIRVPFSAKGVDDAIQKGVKYLLSQQKPDGSWEGFGQVLNKEKKPARDKQGNIITTYPVGPTALVTYAVLASGVDPQEAHVAKALDWMIAQKCTKTYSLGLRANALYLASRKNRKYLKPLAEDVKVLVKSTKNGSYGYSSAGKGLSTGDNSNSQYGLLGVWAGEQAGLEIPKEYWWTVMRHWIQSQNRDGGWAYLGGPTTPTMAAAGVASMFVCFDNLFAEGFIKCNVATEFKPIEKGLIWFDKNFDRAIGGRIYYFLYGVERVALASGYKYFGKSDWYKIGSTVLLNLQSPDGSWPGGFGSLVSTSFSVLFTVRGQHSVLFNKLQFDGDWNNRPRDLAALTRWLGRTFETTVNWQIINLKVPVREWHDAPILYLSASKAPKFTDEDIKKLRQYIYQGGTILSITECHGTGFQKGIREVYKKLFPNYELKLLDPSHEIYSRAVQFKLPGKPKLYMITNGVRPLVIHTDEDLSLDWQLRRWALRKRSFEAAANIFMYITDKKLRKRGVSLWPVQPRVRPLGTVKLARIQHNGNCNPEPLAFERFERMLLKETQTKLEVVGPIPAAKLAESKAQIATMTGTYGFRLSNEDKAALKKFVADGGTLVIDTSGGVLGGGKKFAKQAERLIGELFGKNKLRPLSRLSPLFQQKGLEIDKVKYRRITKRKLANSKFPNLQAIVDAKGRPCVIFSSEDITCGLVGYPNYSMDGYDPGDSKDPGSAYQLMRNIVMMVAKAAK